VAIWYIFHRFGKLCQEKSGNPGVKDPDSLCIEKADKGRFFIGGRLSLWTKEFSRIRHFKRWAKVQAAGGTML
jgi:hypothetical protein